MLCMNHVMWAISGCAGLLTTEIYRKSRSTPTLQTLPAPSSRLFFLSLSRMSLMEVCLSTSKNLNKSLSTIPHILLTTTF